MAIIVGGRALVINLDGKHELNGTIVYVECLLHEAIEEDLCIFGVIGGEYSFEYTLPGMNLMRLDDSDDLVIESYTHWETF